MVRHGANSVYIAGATNYNDPLLFSFFLQLSDPPFFMWTRSTLIDLLAEIDLDLGCDLELTPCLPRPFLA